MSKLSKKGLLFCISALAMAAFTMPSMASAATFDGVGLHTLTSSNLSFTSAGLGGGAQCSSSTFEVDVVAASARVTSATFSGCSGTDGLAACGTANTVDGTNFPWTVTPVTGGFTIDGVHIVNSWTTGPCAGTTVTLAGNLAGAAVTNATHTVTYSGGTGITATLVGGGSAAATVTGDLRDDQGTLAVT